MWDFIKVVFIFIVLLAMGSRIIAKIAFNSKHMSSGTGMLLALIFGIAVTVVMCVAGLDGLLYVMFGTVIGYMFVIATKLLYDEEGEAAIKKMLNNPSAIAELAKTMGMIKKRSDNNE